MSTANLRVAVLLLYITQKSAESYLRAFDKSYLYLGLGV